MAAAVDTDSAVRLSGLTDPLLLGSIDDRMIATMRLMLALLALLSTYIDPGETTHYVAATYAVLALYLAYSITLCTLTVRRRRTIPATGAYWADVALACRCPQDVLRAILDSSKSRVRRRMSPPVP